MDLFNYLKSGTQLTPIKKRKVKRKGKVKWGTPHPKTGFKSFANKPTTQMDKLLTTITASLLQNPADKIRQKEALADYGYVMPIDEARAKVAKSTGAQEVPQELVEEASRKLAKGKIKDKDIDEFLMGVEVGPLRADYLGREYNLDELANDYGKKWKVIDGELDDLLDTLNTGGGVATMRKEALQDLKKKRNDLFKQGLEQEEFMLIGLTDTNKTYRNKFKDTFGKGQLQEYQNNINAFAGRLGEIDDLLDIKQEEAYDFDLKEAMNYSRQEAQEELNLLDLEIEENIKLFDSSRIKD
jgi:hypothetical protein